jgi:hypothetical protein
VPASSFIVASSSVISAIVGSGASGTVAVTTPNGTGSMTGFFYAPPPIITSFNPPVHLPTRQLLLPVRILVGLLL